MLFQLSFDQNRIVGFFGRDGKRYWGAISVGRVLKYKALHQFAYRNSNIDVMDVVIPNQKNHYILKGLKLKLIEEDKFIKFIKKSSLPIIHQFYLEYESKELFVTIESPKAYPSVRRCFKDTPRAINFFQWYADFEIQLMGKEPQTNYLPANSPCSTSCCPEPEETFTPRSPSCCSPPDSPPYTPCSPTYTPPPLLEEPPTHSPCSPSYLASEESLTYSPSSPPYLAPEKPLTYSPSSPPYIPPAMRTRETTSRPAVQNEAGPSHAPSFPMPPSNPGGGGMFWYDTTPPTKVFYFHGNQCYQYVRIN